EQHGERKLILVCTRTHLIVMGGIGGGKRSSIGPPHHRVVGDAIHLMHQGAARLRLLSGITVGNRRLMAVVVSIEVSFIQKLCRRVRVAYADFQPSGFDEGRMDLHRNGIGFLMAHGCHLHRLTERLELTAYLAGPKVEGLLDIGDVVGCHQPAVRTVDIEPDVTQLQAVWILPEPVGCFALPALLMLYAIAGLAAVVIEIIGLQRFLKPISHGIGKAVPPPLGLRAEPYALGIPVGKRRQPGHVYPGCESAVNYGESGQRVYRRMDHMVPGYDRLAGEALSVAATAYRGDD